LYREKQEVERWKHRDPIVTFTDRLRRESLLSDADLTKIESDVASEIDRAVAAAEAGPWEPIDNLTKDVYTPQATL
jgi:pyruvate dehydrogenase E1 component alpha subunit